MESRLVIDRESFQKLKDLERNGYVECCGRVFYTTQSFRLHLSLNPRHNGGGGEGKPSKTAAVKVKPLPAEIDLSGVVSSMVVKACPRLRFRVKRLTNLMYYLYVNVNGLDVRDLVTVVNALLNSQETWRGRCIRVTQIGISIARHSLVFELYLDIGGEA